MNGTHTGRLTSATGRARAKVRWLPWSLGRQALLPHTVISGIHPSAGLPGSERLTGGRGRETISAAPHWAVGWSKASAFSVQRLASVVLSAPGVGEE